jgi:hypothetical protein
VRDGAAHQVKDSARSIDKIVIRTHESAIRIIDKKGPLNNPADRDHCIQYMVAIPMIHGRLTAADYEDDVARDPRVDALRDKMECVEDKQFTKDYLDPEKRSIANAIQVFFKDGSKTGKWWSSIRSAIAAAAPKVFRAGGQVQDQSAAPLCTQAVARNPRPVPGSEETGSDAGQRVRRSVRRLISLTAKD